jgi:cytochrome c556
MRPSSALLALLLTSLLAACGEPADTKPGQPVTHRRAAFSKILHAFEPMGLQLRDGHYEPEKFLARAKELVNVKEGPWEYFGPDTNYPPTHAKPALWTEMEKFEAGHQAFSQATDRLLTAAESRDEKAVRAAYDAVHDTCRSCHKAYKD